MDALAATGSYGTIFIGTAPLPSEGLRSVFGGLGPAILIAKDNNATVSNYPYWNGTQFIAGEVVKISGNNIGVRGGMYTVEAVTQITYDDSTTGSDHSSGDPYDAVQLTCEKVTTTTTTTTVAPTTTTTTTTTSTTLCPPIADSIFDNSSNSFAITNITNFSPDREIQDRITPPNTSRSAQLFIPDLREIAAASENLKIEFQIEFYDLGSAASDPSWSSIIFWNIGSIVPSPSAMLMIRVAPASALLGGEHRFRVTWTNAFNDTANYLNHTTNIFENVKYNVIVERISNEWSISVGTNPLDIVVVSTDSSHTHKNLAINDTLLDDTGYQIGNGIINAGGNSELRASIRDFTISNDGVVLLDLNTKKEYIWSTFGVQQRTNSFQIIEGLTSGAKIDADNTINVSTYVIGTKEQLPFLKPVFGGLGPAFLVAKDMNSDKSNYDSWNKTQFIVGEVVKINLWSTINGMYTVDAINDITYNGDPFHVVQLECVPVTTTTTTTTSTTTTTTTTTTTPPEHELDVVFVRWS